MDSMEQGIPPSFDGSATGYMFALFGLLMVTLFAAEWAMRMVWRLYDDWQGWVSPCTAVRALILLLLVAAIMRGTPDAVLLMQWPELSAEARVNVAGVDRLFDGLAMVPFGLAWLIDNITRDQVTFQLKRIPTPPPEKKSVVENLQRPVKIASGCLAISFAVVFLQ